MSEVTPAASIAQSITTPTAKGDAPSTPAEIAKAPVISTEPPKQTEPKDDERMSARFAALSKREKQLVEKERTMKDQFEKIKQFETEKGEASKSPLAFLQKNGLTLDQVLEEALGTKKEPSVDEKIKQLQDMIELQKKESLDKEKQREEEAKQNKTAEEARIIKNFKDQISKHIDDNAEKYELIKHNSAFDLVFDVIDEHYKMTSKDGEQGTLLTVDQAAEKVEEYLFEEAQKVLKGSKKLAALFASVQEKPASEKENKSPTMTLTNALVNGSTPSNDLQSGYLSREESLKKAAALIKWT